LRAGLAVDGTAVSHRLREIYRVTRTMSPIITRYRGRSITPMANGSNDCVVCRVPQSIDVECNPGCTSEAPRTCGLSTSAAKKFGRWVRPRGSFAIQYFAPLNKMRVSIRPPNGSFARQHLESVCPRRTSPSFVSTPRRSPPPAAKKKGPANQNVGLPSKAGSGVSSLPTSGAAQKSVGAFIVMSSGSATLPRRASRSLKRGWPSW